MSSVSQLGYIGFEVSDPERWETFGTSVMGMEVSNRFDDGDYSFKMDSHQNRIFIAPGPSDDLNLLGLQVDSDSDLETIQKHLTDASITVETGTPEEVTKRGVQRLIKFTEPGGVPCELYTGPSKGSEFQSSIVTSGFFAEENGFGHIALRANDIQETESFFTDMLGFKLSDRIICKMGPVDVNITFLHANPRHHSIAFGVGLPKHIHHFMLQANSIDDVGAAMDRTVENGFRLVQTMGRHPNDKMITFYGETPSGFEFEFGTGGLSIDDSTWEVQTHKIVSEWGHRSPRFYGRQPKVSEASI